MKEMIEERMKACSKHPDKKEIFKLESLLLKAGFPYFFNIWEDLRPVFGQPEGNPETDIDWNTYNFLIEVGGSVACGYSGMSVCFNTEGDRELLELLDMRQAAGKENPTEADGKLYRDLTAEQAMEILKKYFDEQ